jgi:hypothetical protein
VGEEMTWSEPALVEYPFRFGAKQRSAMARLGFPRLREGDSEWSCAFQIEGWKDDRVRLARGVDGLQALTIASTVIRKSLDRLKDVVSDVTPYEVIFPRYVPFCLGIEHHRKLCNILDAEVKKKQRQLSRRRLKRKKLT